MHAIEDKNRKRTSELLYPMLVIAAIAVTVFSLVGIATMMGWMPSALSVTEQVARPGTTVERSSALVPQSPSVASRHGGARKACIDCGVIESVRAVEVSGQNSRIGAGGGTLVGALRNQKVRVTNDGIAAAG